MRHVLFSSGYFFVLGLKPACFFWDWNLQQAIYTYKYCLKCEFHEKMEDIIIRLK